MVCVSVSRLCSPFWPTILGTVVGLATKRESPRPDLLARIGDQRARLTGFGQVATEVSAVDRLAVIHCRGMAYQPREADRSHPLLNASPYLLCECSRFCNCESTKFQ